MWSVDAYDYIEQNHPRLWMIEANATYRGWFVGGEQAGEWGNKGFVAAHVAGHGALGDFFVKKMDTIKMGDSPSVGWLLKGDPTDPSQGGWGGKFVRVWNGRKRVFERMTSEADKVEVFGVVEFSLPLPADFGAQHTVQVVLDKRVKAATDTRGGRLRFRFSPRDAKVWSYAIKSNHTGLEGREGKFTAVPAEEARTKDISTTHGNWWIDDMDAAVAEEGHWGAKSVNRWRKEILADFRERMEQCRTPKMGNGP
jgi:hypothetical protein